MPSGPGRPTCASSAVSRGEPRDGSPKSRPIGDPPDPPDPRISRPEDSMRAAASLLSLMLIVPACNAVVLDAAPQAPSTPDCSAPEFRQFDFWLGSWNVTVQGKPA